MRSTKGNALHYKRLVELNATLLLISRAPTLPLILPMDPSSSSSSSSSSAAAAVNGVKVLEQSRVSPPPGSVAEVSVPLTFFDATWIHSDHQVEHIFFYHLPRPFTYLIDLVVPKLKSSLSLALQHFYPLAGNVRLAPGTNDKYEIHYKDGYSVSFVVAESDADLYDLSESHAREFNKLYALVPKFPPTDDDARPLLVLQVTLFPNSGISIGLAIHHAACDGSGTMHFIKSWASACSSGGSLSCFQRPPLIDRSAIPDPHGFYSHVVQFRQRNPIRRAPSSTKSDLVCATFTLGIDKIRKLKQFATAKTETPFHCSTFVVACAYAWVCVAKARRYPRDEATLIVFTIDIRGSVLLPCITTKASYFGNCVRPCHVEALVSELVKDDDGFRVAAEAIGRAIQRDRTVVVEDAKEWPGRTPVTRMAGRILAVAGSHKYGVYDVDFGWGRPRKFETTSLESAVVGGIGLAESRDEPGGIEIGLMLPKDVMLEFASCFSAGFQLASDLIRSSL